MDSSEHFYIVTKSQSFEEHPIVQQRVGAFTALMWKVKTQFTLILMYGNFPYKFSNECYFFIQEMVVQY